MGSHDAAEALSADLITLLERHVLHAPDLDEFWSRADTVRRLLPGSSSRPRASADTPSPEPTVLHADLYAALTAALDGGDLDDWALHELLDEWEELWMDEEKLTGHLIRQHGDPAEPTGALTADDLLSRHLDLHRPRA